MKHRYIAIILVCLLSVIVFIPIVAQYLDRVNIQTTGQIESIGLKVYGDSNLTNELTEINWGVRNPGSVMPVTMYIYNDGTEPIHCTIETSEWIPTNADEVMSITWNYDGTIIMPQGVEQVIVSLVVSPLISGITNFSFVITIVGA